MVARADGRHVSSQREFFVGFQALRIVSKMSFIKAILKQNLLRPLPAGARRPVATDTWSVVSCVPWLRAYPFLVCEVAVTGAASLS